MRISKAIAVASVLLTAGASSAGAVTYDLAAGFSSLNDDTASPWSYGYFSGGFGVYFPNYVAASPGSPLEYWNDPSLSQTATFNTPSDVHNTSNSEATCCNSVVWLPNQVTFHPGQNGEVAAYRFTAPTTGSYALTSSFSGRDYVGPTDTQVSINVDDGPSIFTGIVDGYAGDSARAAFGPSPTTSFDDTISLQAGDNVFFEVGFDPSGSRSSGPFYYDTTGISVSFATVPEPSTWTILLIGFFGLGSMVRFVGRKRDLLTNA